MKVFWISIIIFVVICIFIGVHSTLMARMEREIEPHLKVIPGLAHSEEWNGVQRELKKISNCWSKYRPWAALTISTKDIEQIEVALGRCLIFAQIEQKADFFGEFTNFEYIVNYLPQREGFHLREIL